MVEMFGAIHLSVEEASKEFWEMLRRRNYVTPTSYLELLSSFKTLLNFKQNQVFGYFPSFIGIAKYHP